MIGPYEFEEVHAHSAVSSPEYMISRLIMGFVERKVSPQTIADMVRAQLLEGGISPMSLHDSTANGILEVVCNTPSVLSAVDFIFYFSVREDFPSFLSLRSSVGCLTHLFKILPRVLEEHPDSLLKFSQVIDKIALQIHRNLFEGNQHSQEKTRILSLIKTLPVKCQSWVFGSCKAMVALKVVLHQNASGDVQKQEPLSFAKPIEVFHHIVRTDEHFLAQKGVSFFKCYPQEDWVSWRLGHLDLLISEMNEGKLSPYQKTFLTEWFFSGILLQLLYDESLLEQFHSGIRFVLEEGGGDFNIFKGLLRSLQTDLSVCAMEMKSQGNQSKLSQLMLHAEYLFVIAIAMVQKQPLLFSRQIATWALQTPIQPSEARLFTKKNWIWLKTLSLKQWEDELREPPAWILTHGSRFCASVFHMAPGSWLQEHSYKLIERLLIESVQGDFVINNQHIDYIEFICRSLRKKSPAFAVQHEMLLSLRFLSRCTLAEENQLKLLETRYKMMKSQNGLSQTQQFWRNLLTAPHAGEKLGSHPVARALQILLYISRDLASEFQNKMRQKI